MNFALNSKIPPKEWWHEPDKPDKLGNTVAMYLSDS